MSRTLAIAATIAAITAGGNATGWADAPVHPKARLDVELTTQARAIVQAGEDLTDLRLDRGELGAVVDVTPDVGAEFRLEAIRSASDGGSLGVDGDSTVVRVKYAQVVGGHALTPWLRIDGAMGFVPDPWIRSLEDAYPLKALSRTGSERLLGWQPSDLALFAQMAAGPVRLAVHVGNGEGLRFPERNSGKTTTAVLGVEVLATRVVRLDAAVVGRDGSIGAGAIRDRRLGAQASIATPWLRAGGEVVRAWGIGNRGDLEGWLAEGWAEGHVLASGYVAARAATLGYLDHGGRTSTFGGAVAYEPWREAGDRTERERGRVRVWLAVDRVTTRGDAMPVLGADSGDATTIMLIASALAPITF